MSDSRNTSESRRLTPSALGRVHDHQREGETLSATIERMADALDREAALPESVRETLREGEA